MKLSWSPVISCNHSWNEKKDAMLTDKSLIENLAPQQATFHILTCIDRSPIPVISST